MQQVLLISVPATSRDRDSIFQAIESLAGKGKVYDFPIPRELTVGTLDSLMALSDDLTKINVHIENVAKKVERQYLDIKGSEPLRANQKTIDAYLKHFEWDFAKYQFKGHQLTEIVGNIQSMVARIDEELKKYATEYAEKNIQISTLQRKRVINMATSDFEDFLKPEKVASMGEFEDGSFALQRVMVVVPRSLEKEFERIYSTLGSDIAAFGGPDWTNSSSIGKNDGKFGTNINRSATKGSPVVPGSLKKEHEEGDAFLFSILVLKGHYEAGIIVDSVARNGKFVDYMEPLKTAFREKRFTLREFKYDVSKTGGVEADITKAQNQYQQLKANLSRFCSAHFGEAIVALMHLKAIKCFVESVLRYGIPFEVLSVMVEVDPKREKLFRSALTGTILNIKPELMQKKSLQEDDEEEESADNLPFVCQKFSVIGV